MKPSGLRFPWAILQLLRLRLRDPPVHGPFFVQQASPSGVKEPASVLSGIFYINDQSFYI